MIELSNPSVTRLETPSSQFALRPKQQIDDVVELLSRAFEGDHWIRAIVGNNWKLLPLLYRAMVGAALLRGEIHVVSLDSGEICSVGVWYGPGRECWQTEEERKAGMYDFLSQLDPESQHWLTKIYPDEHNNFFNGLLTEKEKIGSWKPWAMATELRHRRKGYARAIVDYVFQKAEDDNTVLMVGTNGDENVLIYQRMGFELRGRMDIDSAPAGKFEIACLTRS